MQGSHLSRECKSELDFYKSVTATETPLTRFLTILTLFLDVSPRNNFQESYSLLYTPILSQSRLHVAVREFVGFEKISCYRSIVSTH